MSNSLIENHLDRNTGIGTCQNRSIRLLLIERFLLEDENVLCVGGVTARYKARITIHEFLEGLVRSELTLSHDWTRRRELDAFCGSETRHGPSQSHLKEASPGRFLGPCAGFQIFAGAARFCWNWLSVSRSSL